MQKQVASIIDGLRSKGNLAQLIRGSGGSFIARSLSAALAFASTMILTRFLGTSEYGDYTSALVWLTALVLIGRHGLNKAAIRYLSTYESQQRWGHMRGFLSYSRRKAYVISFALAAVVVVAVYVSRAFIVARFGEGFFHVLLIAMAALPFLAQLQISEGILDGYHRVFQSQISLRMVRPTLIALSMLVIYYGSNIGRVVHDGTVYLMAEVGMTVNVIAIFVSLGLALYLVHRAIPREASSEVAVFEKREWSTTSRDMMWTSGFNLVLVQADMMMIGPLVDNENVGIYHVATKVAELLIIALTATNAILHPIAARLYAGGEHKELQRIVSIGANVVFIVGMLGAVVLYFGADFIVGLFGENRAYAGASPLLRVLIIGQLVNAFAGPALLLLNMTGHQRDAARIMAATAFLNIGLNYTLISTLGTLGAAIATAATTVTWNAGAAYFVWRRLRIVSIAFWRFSFKPLA